jgi:hypothetical protein
MTDEGWNRQRCRLDACVDADMHGCVHGLDPQIHDVNVEGDIVHSHCQFYRHGP